MSEISEVGQGAFNRSPATQKNTVKILYEHDGEDVTDGVMAISGHGTALEVFEASGCSPGMIDYNWGPVSDGTVFDPKKIKTLEDIDRYYAIGVFTSKEKTEKSGTRLVRVVKTVKTHCTIIEKE